MNISCSNQDPCPVILDSKCVIYEGENLLFIGVNTNDNYRFALEQVNTAIGNLILTGGITQLTGDVIALGPGVTPATLATVNSTPGQYGSSTAIPKLTVDGKGRVTAITTEAVFIPSGALSFIGDVTGTGNTGSNTTLTLATVNSNVYTTNTFLKFSANGKGLVTSATAVVSADITSALGYTPYNATNPSNFISRLGLSASSPLSYDNVSGNFTIQQANATQNGYLSSTDWNTFNSKQSALTFSSPLVNTAGTISIPAASGSVNGYLSSTDWTTFNNKQVAGNYITDLTGEATAAGPGIANVTLNNSAVTGKVLTGINITGGSIVATDSILTAFGKAQNQINSLIGGSIYKGTWNAATNTPVLTSGIGTAGNYYIVSVAGSTNLDGITDWNLGDWAIFDGTAWQQVDNTDAVVSVNGFTGAVSLTTDNISEGLTNQYFTTSRARLALSGGTGISYDNVTGVITNSSPDQTVAISSGAGINVTGTYPNFTIASTITQYTDALARGAISLTTTGTSGAATYNSTTGVLNIPVYSPDLSGYVPTSRTLTINGTSYDLTADRSWTIATNPGTVTSVALSRSGDALAITGSPITSAGTINIGFAGLASQYIRGDGNLANFPTSGGGGSSVAYYFNSSVSQGTIGGVAYRQLSKTAIVGAGTDINISANGYVASYITDANDPALLQIPGGNWIFEMFFSANNGSGTPSFYVELYKYNGTTFTLIASSSATPEGITNGTAIDLYTTALAVPTTSLTVTDRLAIRVYVNTSNRTITLHTEDSHLCEVITTFSTGLTALNGLTAQVQYFQTGTSGSDFNISSATATHTFNLPDASATNRGLITTGTQTIAGAKTFTSGLGGTSAAFSGSLSVTGNTSLLGNLGAKFGIIIEKGNTPATLSLNDVYISASSGTTNSLKIQNTNYLSTLNFSQSNQTFTFPEATGTLALTSDIPSLSGYVPTSRVLTINGVSYNLTADASWTVATGVSGSGTTNYLSKWTGSTSVGNSVAFDNGSAIGINTTSPHESASFKLDVNGGVIIKNTSGTTAQLILIDSNPATGGNNGFVQLTAGGNTGTAFGQWQTYYGTSIASGTLRLQPSGGVVLVGSTTAVTGAGMLQVAGDVNITGSFKINGTAISSGGVSSFNTRTGAVSLTSGDVTGALGFTPYNSTNPSGFITSSGTAAAVSQTVTGTNSAELVRGNMADNDQFRILVGGTGSNAGFVEIATADDGTEPIYVRQYTGVFSSLTRTLTLLDGSGNTSFPGTISASNYSGTHSGSSSGTNTGDQTNISGNAATATNSSQLNGISSTQIFNNMGQNHGTYQDFNSVGNFGIRYMQGSTNGPQSGQFYGMTLGLGNDYSYGTYASQFYWLRNTTNPYIWIRYQEGGSWTAWTKTSAGYADNAGNTNSVSNATGGTYTWTGAQNNFLGNGNTGSTNNVGMIIYSNGGNGAQFSFHRAGYYAINMGLDSDNVIRIGGWSASPNRFQMDMSGNLTMSGDVTAYSDARVKENVETIKNALNKVLALRGVSYNRTDSDDKKTKIGVIAQETLPILPEVVNQDNDGMYNVSYGNMGGLFIEAFKEQQKKIDAQDKIIEELKTIINDITK